jgi:hypothetical protein
MILLLQFLKLGETSDTPPELPPIYTKPPRYEKTLRYPPQSSRFSHLGPFWRNLPIIPFTPKLRRFGLAQNGVVLAHFLF